MLCRANPSRICSRNLKSKYLIDDHLRARCGAAVRVELVDEAGERQENIPSLNGALLENVFVLPGIGRLVFQAIANRDLVVVRDVVMWLVAGVVVVNFFVDLLYALVDPRLKAGDA